MIITTETRAPLMPLAEARRCILNKMPVATRHQCRPLAKCCNRILAENVVARCAVPAHTNAALDGYALCGAELPSDAQRCYRLVGSAFAGRPWPGVLQKDVVVRVMTGAVMPSGADTVVAWEQAEVIGEQVCIGAGHRYGQNVRATGEDIAAGDIALAVGTRLLAPQLGVAASLGCARLPVFASPRAVVLSSGDELCEPGSVMSTGTVYDSNRFLLTGFLQRLGVQIKDRGIVRDRAHAMEKALRRAARTSDLILISGGASRGAADFVMKAVDKLGEVILWSVALRPGRPFGFGIIKGRPVFVLPGNPVAVATTFLLLVTPALSKMIGARESVHEQVREPFANVTVRATCLTAFAKKPQRTDVYRAVLERDDNGNATVRALPQQGSGMLLSLAKANCLVVLDHDAPPAKVGDAVTVYPFYGLL